MSPTAEIAVVGGSGFYAWLEDPTEIRPHTPYGPPSAALSVGVVGGRSVAFLPRHGSSHEWPPHRVNYRANRWALRSLGVRRVIGPCAVGSLRPDFHPGDLVVLDQLVDRTSGRADTYLDGSVAGHVTYADPYCPELGEVLAAAGESIGAKVHRGGTVVVIQGPRFSTRAESRWFRSQGWDVVNMTQYPEAVLARELGLCFGGLALVTDYDTGVDGDDTLEAVSFDAVMAVLAANVSTARRLLDVAVPAVPPEPGCACRDLGWPDLARAGS